MRRLSPLLLAPLLLGCLPGDGPLIRVVNADSVTIDRVIVAAGGSEYALGRLLPGTSGQVRPAPPADSVIQIRHHGGGPFPVAADFAGGARVVEIRLHADSVGEVRLQR